MNFSPLFRTTLLAICLSSIFANLPAAGSVYLSNLDDASNGGYGVSGGAGLGQPFLTGSSPGGYSLNSVTLPMLDWSQGVSAFQVYIYANLGTSLFKPTTRLATLTGNNDPETTGLYDYTCSGLILKPNTPYWVVAMASGPVNPGGITPAYFWEDTRDTTYATTDGWQILTGNSFANYITSTGIWNVFPSTTYGSLVIAVDATPVPEPGLPVLIGLGLGTLARWRGIRLGSVRLN